jgi:hypothetical protein
MPCVAGEMIWILVILLEFKGCGLKCAPDAAILRFVLAENQRKKRRPCIKSTEDDQIRG